MAKTVKPKILAPPSYTCACHVLEFLDLTKK